MFEISKSFQLSYGHRVHLQTLDIEYSLDTDCACRYLHGHNATINVNLSSKNLNDQGMVVDFKMLNWFKKWLDDTLDHKFIMDINDPLIEQELSVYGKEYELALINTTPKENKLIYNKEYGYYLIDKKLYKNLPNHFIEKFEGLLFVDFVPTSENLSKWLYGIVENKMDKINIKVSKLEFYETPKSKSVYHNSFRLGL